LKGGDLLEAVTKRSKFDEEEAIYMIFSLAHAINYIHALKIVHRDIKLENIFVRFLLKINFKLKERNPIVI
jgi:serine/threonine protein kinase